jgi:PAS domain S-box-containing protein
LNAGETVAAEEIEILRGDGTRGSLLVSSAPVRDPEGRVTAAVVTFHDVTERRELEESLRRSELRFRTIIEQFPLSTQVLAPDGTTLMVNRAWEQLWGVTLEQIRGYNLLEDAQLVEKGAMPFLRAAFAGTASEVPAIRYEPELSIAELGAVPFRWVRAFVFPVKDQVGAIREVVLIHEDVTERRRAEESREEALAEAEQRRDEAERAQGSLQTFLGVVAHDLRGPLTSIRGNAQMLRRRQDSVDPERRARALKAIEDEAGRMNGMIGALVDAARVGAGQLEVRPEPTDLVPLARRAVESAQAGSERHRVVFEAPDELPGVWDPGRLAQVLDNLLGNAVKYSPAGGEVRLRVERRGAEAVVSVTDQGVGIRPEEQPRLFELFSRLDTAGAIEGTGLGLYITRGIVEAHGGRVWAESAGPGAGATFTVAVPLGGEPRDLPPVPEDADR